MRLLHSKTLRVCQFSPADVPEYAILSHTWEAEEVTFHDMGSLTPLKMHGCAKLKNCGKGAAKMHSYAKLMNCCKRAAKDGFDWVWVDTCCIDKTSSAELSEAISSMYNWYHHSAICYVFLADLQSNIEFKDCKWFTRGWTLQELIAPRRLVIFDAMWNEIGSKESKVETISSITGIPNAIIKGRSPLSCNVAQRMSWASKRQTTRGEDMAYSLMGLFDVHMPPMYGEGSEQAFVRLQEQIILQNLDQTLFLWEPAHEPYNQGLLATSPASFCTDRCCFEWCPEIFTSTMEPFDPYSYFYPDRRRFPTISFSGDGAAEKPAMHWPNERNGEALHPILLAPAGIHIPLLMDVSRTGKNRNFDDDPKFVCLDVVFADSHGLRPIMFILTPEQRTDYARSFVPNRIGDWRRRVCFRESSSYFSQLGLDFRFKRKFINVSQLRTSTLSTTPATFCLEQIQHFQIDDCTLLQPAPIGRLSDLNQPFKCRSAVASVRHLCDDCNKTVGLMLVFGVRGKDQEPWCLFAAKKAAELSDPSNRNVCREVEYLNARSYGDAAFFLTCEQCIWASIESNENYHGIHLTLTPKYSTRT